MESIKSVKKRVRYFKVKYIPIKDPLDPNLKCMISQDKPIKYSAICNSNKETIKVFCKEEDINLIRDNLENIIKDKLANALWISILAKATSEDLYDALIGE